MSDVDSPKPVVKAKTTDVTESVVVATDAFDARLPTLVDEAEQSFRKLVAETRGDNASLENVKLVAVNHHIGHQVEYTFSATVKN